MEQAETTVREAVPLLIGWYREKKREMPWREEPTPYHVWLSEIMLQQTRIEAVKPYYARFLAELPDIPSLAAVEEDKLLKLWEGLGYYSRARNLKKAAETVMAEYGGELPADVEKLRSLAGIGDYTAGAVASLAFGLPEPAVDGNVLRVMARLTLLREDVMQPKTRKAVTSLLRSVYPAGEEAGLLTSGLMELGEVPCIPNGEPRCGECPLRRICLAHREGCETSLPVKSPKRERRVEKWTVYLLRCGERYALEKRPDTGLLASLWGFPMKMGEYGAETEDFLRELGLNPEKAELWGEARHIFTHVEWEMQGVFVPCDRELPGYFWFTPEELRRDKALPTAFRAFAGKI